MGPGTKRSYASQHKNISAMWVTKPWKDTIVLRRKEKGVWGGINQLLKEKKRGETKGGEPSSLGGGWTKPFVPIYRIRG